MNKIKYCWDNDIKIYPVPVPRSGGNKRPNCKIEIDYKGSKRQGTEIYKQDTKLYDKITQLYEVYYEKLS